MSFDQENTADWQAPQWAKRYEKFSNKYIFLNSIEENAVEHDSDLEFMRPLCPGTWADVFQRRRRRFTHRPRSVSGTVEAMRLADLPV
eukprot:752334-Hanusia_phi.AAC.1